nr:hypothetical protein [Tanacetum cinerariifolium]
MSMDINIDALYNILKQNQGYVNDAMGLNNKIVVVTSDPLALIAEKTNVSRSKEKVVVSSDSEGKASSLSADEKISEKTVVVTSDPLALIAEKTNVSRSKEKVVVSSDSKGSEADDFSKLKKITALLAKAFNQRKFYSKLINNNLRTSSNSQSANKKQEFVMSDDKQVVKKVDEKKRDASSSSTNEKISEVSYYLSESESESEFETSEYYDKSTNYGLFVNNDDG